MISIEYALPLFIFLVVSFLAFYFIETVFLFALSYYTQKHLSFIIDKVLRTVVHHRTLMRIAAFGVVSLVIIFLSCSTSIIDILIGGIGVLRFLAVILIITMLMIYYIGIQTISKVVIVRRMHLLFFIIISLFTFTGIMSTAQTWYGVYQTTISKAFMKPLVTGIEQNYEKKLEGLLLAVFESKLKNGECHFYDYANGGGTGLTQFFLVKHDRSLAFGKSFSKEDGGGLAGKNCVLETKYLLTPEGDWYRVEEQKTDTATVTATAGLKAESN